MILSTEPLRLGGALLLSGGYLAMCFALWRARLRQRPAPGGHADWLVAYASQTGSAEFLAQKSAQLLRAGGLDARAACISTLDAAALAGERRVLFIGSTYGEGDAPDAAARFAEATMTSAPDLSHLRYAVLALGDSSYVNFCGFGRALDAWLAERGATALFERIDVDRGAPESIAGWQRQLGTLAGTGDTDGWHAPAFQDWRIATRTLLNPGSAGAPLYRLAFRPAGGALPAWEAGDLAQVSIPAAPGQPRDYSIASVPGEGRLELLVRLRRTADGGTGLASGWLCEQAGEGDTIALRVRPHARFRSGDNAARPLVAIGAGSGLAGLRAHLKARIDAGHADNWLLFGERSAAHDFIQRDELEGWRAAGLLQLDLAFSRDGAGPRYVQDLLRERAGALTEWVASGAAIYVCGSMHGMAGGVHEALCDILGADTVGALADSGRYRRDVY